LNKSGAGRDRRHAASDIAAIGMDMVTPPKTSGEQIPTEQISADHISGDQISADRGRPPRTRIVLPQVWLLATLGIVAALLLPPMWSGPVQPEATARVPTLTQENVRELCLGLQENPKDYMSDIALRHRWA